MSPTPHRPFPAEIGHRTPTTRKTIFRCQTLAAPCSTTSLRWLPTPETWWHHATWVLPTQRDVQRSPSNMRPVRRPQHRKHKLSPAPSLKSPAAHNSLESLMANNMPE